MTLADYDIPEVLGRIPELQFCFKLSEDFTNFFLEKLTQLQKELDPETTSEKGIARFEKMYGITPRPTDSLEERRFRVKVSRRVIDVLNFPNLQKLVDYLTSGDGSVTQDTQTKKVKVNVGLSSIKMFSLVQSLIGQYLPVCVSVEVIQTYKTFRDYANQTYKSLSGKTWNELREGNAGNE